MNSEPIESRRADGTQSASPWGLGTIVLICRSFVKNAAERAFKAMPMFTMGILTGYCKARMLFESGMEVAA